MSKPQQDLKIAFVAHALKAGGGISIGQNLISAVSAQFPDAKCWASIPAGLGYEDAIDKPNIEYSLFKQKGWFQQWYYERYELPGLINDFRPDFVIALANRLVHGVSAAQALLLHDPHLFYPVKYYSRETTKRKLLKAIQRRWLASDASLAQYLFVQTSTAAERVNSQFSVKGQLIKIPNAVSQQVNVDQQYARPTAFKGHEGCFKLFYLTRYYPHKNLELLVDAFDRYAEELADVRLFLTIDASQHSGAAKLLASIAEKGLDDRIINVGPLPQKELGGYFSNCDALVMPTTLESFSATYLEAMAFDTPILTSDLDFAREICGDAALYFDPWSTQDLNCAIRRLIEDRALRASLTVAGRERLEALKWSWDENGAVIAEIISDQTNHSYVEDAKPATCSKSFKI